MQHRAIHIKVSILIIIALVLTNCVACGEQKAQAPDWPRHVIESVWIPEGAAIDHYSHRLSYDVYYKVDACYPAKGLIAEMVGFMVSRGWRRLDYNPDNPESPFPLNHAMMPAPRWIGGLTENYCETYGWNEFWEDREKNTIQYAFTYQLRKGEAIETACSVSGVSSYISNEDHELFLKAFQGMPVRPPIDVN